MKKLDIRKVPVSIILLLLFMLGYAAGIILIFFNSKSLLVNIELLTPKFFYRLENISIDKRALLLLILGRQVRNFFLLVFLSTTGIGKLVLYSYTVFRGIFIGSTMELMMILYGITGLGVYALLVLPHGIFYFLGYSILIVQRVQYTGTKEEVYTFFDERKERGKKLIVALLLLIVGSIAEAYCNLFMLFYNY